MKRFWLITFAGGLLAAMVLAGCTSEAAVKRKEREAFLAGEAQGEAAARGQGAQQAVTADRAQAPSVFVSGNVKYNTVPFFETLTLRQALLEAQWIGITNPVRVTLIRKGETANIDPQRLLQGDDVPLEAGDRIEIQ